MKLCLFECLGLSWQPPWHPWIFVCHIWIRRPRKPFNYVKNSSISCTELNSLWFWHGFFLFKFGWHGNSLGFLKNSDSVLKLPNPEIPTVHAKNFSISCRELMSAIFFHQIWLPWQSRWLPWNFVYHVWICRPRKPIDYVINSSISCSELKSVQFWLIFLPKFGYHGNSLGSVESFGSIFEFVDP